ncbi:glycosyltransferase [Solilutibacter silvestris]|uniref:glycosyltransferase n=1 Tax=Solilutibacter silvestris TaxID=1645665 RepID=UPI003D3285BD
MVARPSKARVRAPKKIEIIDDLVGPRSSLNTHQIRANGWGTGLIESDAEFLPRRRALFYVTPRGKYLFSLLLATVWMLFSIWASQPWLHDLSRQIGFPLAVTIITMIAYVPGFMNMFLMSTIALDRRPPRMMPARYPAVSILVACYNESQSVADTLRSLATQDYPGDYEVIVLDDGSTDDTLYVAGGIIETDLAYGNPRAHFRIQHYPTNAGKSAVLNRGLEIASHELIVTVDGDSWLHSNALRHIVERKISDPPGTRAVAGAVLARNATVNMIAGVQEWDYFFGIAAVKRMQSMYHGTLVAQGAFSLYERSALLEVGGWPHCVGEDIVLSWALLARGARIGYAEDALVFTNVPDRFAQFARQRKRWSRGLMEAFRHHWRLLFKGRMSTLFVWWNLLFLPLDLTYTFAFVPGILLALFGYYWLVSLWTLLILPLTLLWTGVIYRVQHRMLQRQHLKLRHKPVSVMLYVFLYSIILQPVCVWGYAAELMGLRKKWDTK